MPVDIEALRQVPLFAPLEPDELAHVAAVVVERRYERGDLILLEGARAGALHFVRQGRVKVFKTSPEGKEQVLRLIGPGQTFNDVPALDGGPNPASAAAMAPSVVYVVGSRQLRQLIVERPAVAEAAVQTLAGALRHLVALVEDLSFRHVTARVAKLLLDQEEEAAAAAAAAGGAGGGEATTRGKATAHRLTQQEMAAMTGTAREMVGRALKDLEAAGAIAMRQGRVVVVDRERLRRLA